VTVSPGEVRDPFGVRVSGFDLGRDPERAPMAWDGSASGGFSDAKPWLPLPVKYQQLNVADENQDSGSTLNLYRQLINFRRKHPELSLGEFKLEATDSDDVLLYSRGEGMRVVANFADAAQTAPDDKGWKLLISTHSDSSPGMLAPHEGRLYARKQS
jgi:alpha-glucosidase